jgi:hypothetical protein
MPAIVLISEQQQKGKEMPDNVDFYFGWTFSSSGNWYG